MTVVGVTLGENDHGDNLMLIICFCEHFLKVVAHIFARVFPSSP